MTDLATLTVQIALIAFLAWGAMLSLRCFAQEGTGNFRAAG